MTAAAATASEHEGTASIAPTVRSTASTSRRLPVGPAAGSIADEVERLRVDPIAWDAFVSACPNGSFPQLTAWAQANATNGWHATRMVADAPGGPVGAQVLIHRMRPGPWSRGYAPRGPLAETLEREAIAAFTAEALRAGRELRLSHLVIDPEIEAGSGFEGWLTARGWRTAPIQQINRTRVIDLSVAEEALWSGLRSSARWSVNKARRAGYTVKDAGEAGLDDFERIYAETAKRVGFAPGAFRDVYRAFAAHDAARLLLCRDPSGGAVATLVLLDRGPRVTELYGASTADGAKARANYLVKWEAIRSSRERGRSSYDMWGTDEPGVADFKAGFGGVEREYVGAWELVIDRRAYAALSAARGLRWVVSTVRSGTRRLAGRAAPRRTASG